MKSATPARTGHNSWDEMRKPVLAGLIAFLLVRCSWWAFALERPDGGVLIDSRGYLLLAENLRRSGEYIADEGTDLAWPPGYPVFINLVFATLGERLPSIALAQLVLSGAASLLLYAAGEAAGNRRAGMAAAWLFAISPPAALWSLTVMSETLFSFFLIGATVLWVLWLRSRRAILIVLAGSFLALGVLTRPIALLLPLLWGFLTALVLRREGGWRRALGFAALLLLPALIAVLGWSWRNYRTHTAFTFGTVGERTMLNFNVGEIVAEVRGISRDEAMLEIAAWEDPGKEALRFILAHPAEAAGAQVEGILKSVFGFDLAVWAQVMGIVGGEQGFGITQSLLHGDFQQALSVMRELLAEPRTRPLAVILLASLLQLVLVYCAIGWLALRRIRRQAMWPPTILLPAATAAYLLLIPLASGTARFRVPAEPFLYLMGGLSLTGDVPLPGGSLGGGRQARRRAERGKRPMLHRHPSVQ